MDIIHAVLIVLFLRYVDFLNREISTGKHGLFKAAAFGAVALMLDDIEDFVAFIAFGKTGDYVNDEICALKNTALNGDVIYVFNILGNYQRKLADVENNLFNLRYVVFLGEFFNRADYLSYYADFVHGNYFFEIILTAIRPTALGALDTAVRRVLW